MNLIKSRLGSFTKNFNKDESAPTTIEWILLLVVALIVMIIIYTVVEWIAADAGKQKETVETKRKAAVEAAEKAFKSK